MENFCYNLDNRNFPAVYKLSTNMESIVFTIHPELWKQIRHTKINTKYIELFQNRFKIPEFVFHNCFSWGFGGVAEIKENKNEWPKIRIEIPTRKQEKNFFYSICATIHIFFRFCSFFDVESDCNENQLMHIDTACTKDITSGMPIFVSLSPTFCNWVEQQTKNEDLYSNSIIPSGNTKVDGVCESMQYINNYIFDRDGKCDIKVSMRKPNFLSMSVPGNACYLDPEIHTKKNGYKLYPHNIDGPTQQLTLLYGLAKASELARKEINENSK